MSSGNNLWIFQYSYNFPLPFIIESKWIEGIKFSEPKKRKKMNKFKKKLSDLSRTGSKLNVSV